ncbi:MAG: hypothetical protein COA55_00020 [Alcanivorax sp.]|nr:MAG: hypothetical protein COA55_00020 [Alcanivorax sp.]
MLKRMFFVYPRNGAMAPGLQAAAKEQRHKAHRLPDSFVVMANLPAGETACCNISSAGRAA